MIFIFVPACKRYLLGSLLFTPKNEGEEETITKKRNCNQSNNYKIAIGFGGTHYCSNFNKIVLKTDIAISHVCPRYHLDKLDRGLIAQAVEKTKEKVDFVLLDWKGLGKEKQRIAELLRSMGLEAKRTDKL